MENLPYEVLFLIARNLSSPVDLCSFALVCTRLHVVSLDDRLWKILCARLYRYHDNATNFREYWLWINENRIWQYFLSFSAVRLFTKVLIPYGRYLGYWKSNETYFGGLNNVIINSAEEKIDGFQICPIEDESDFDDIIGTEDDQQPLTNSETKPVNFNRRALFSINTRTNEIYCHQCEENHEKFPWKQTFESRQTFFGLSHDLLSTEQAIAALSNDSTETDGDLPNGDVFFVRTCPKLLETIIYRPLFIPRSICDEQSHIFQKYNGIWVGSYGGHGFELLHLQYIQQFQPPVLNNDAEHESQFFPNALVATKISGDTNVPHGKISFAATDDGENTENPGQQYPGIGQSNWSLIENTSKSIYYFNLFHSSCSNWLPFSTIYSYTDTFRFR